MAKKATTSQIGSFLSGLIALFFSEKAEKIVSELQYAKIQDAIDWEDKLELLKRIVKFINNGFNFVIDVAQHVINFDASAKMPFAGASLSERDYAITGDVAFNPSEWIAKNELKDGETYITGHEFLKRLKAGKKVLPNSNMINWLVEHQNELGVKEFLEQYKGKVLYAFGDIFRDSDGDLCVRCAIWDGDAWVSSCYWLGLTFVEHLLALSQKTK